MYKRTLTEEVVGEDALTVEVRVKDATDTVEATPTVRVEVVVRSQRRRGGGICRRRQNR